MASGVGGAGGGPGLQPRVNEEGQLARKLTWPGQLLFELWGVCVCVQACVCAGVCVPCMCRPVLSMFTHVFRGCLGMCVSVLLWLVHPCCPCGASMYGAVRVCIYVCV